MVQTALLFAFGFLTAAFMALAVGPAIWRRSAELTRKRIEASLPLTLNELNADKDQQRAEFAIALRKVEAKAKSLQEKVTGQQIDVAANRERVRQYMAERDASEQKSQALDAELAKTAKDLADHKNEVVALNATVADLDGQTKMLRAELEAREKAIVDLQIDLDHRRIELVARATESEQLSGKVSEVSNVRRRLEEKIRETAGEMRAARESIRLAERKATDLEKRGEKLAVQLADREARLQKRETELGLIKEEMRKTLAAKTAFEQLAQSTERQRSSLEKQNARIEERLEKLASMAVPGSAEKSMKKLQDDKARLMSMVERLTAEKDDLVRKLRAATENHGADAALREDLHNLAAKVVALSAEAEGAQSPIARLVSPLEAPEADDDSLAGRIRAVQKAARRGK